MHREQHGDVVFVFNGDCSGYVEIHNGSFRVTVPFDALLSFVLERMKAEAISRIEDLDSKSVWAILTGKRGG